MDNGKNLYCLVWLKGNRIIKLVVLLTFIWSQVKGEINWKLTTILPFFKSIFLFSMHIFFFRGRSLALLSFLKPCVASPSSKPLVIAPSFKFCTISPSWKIALINCVAINRLLLSHSIIDFVCSICWFVFIC